jgi:hypothetical protein
MKKGSCLCLFTALLVLFAGLGFSAEKGENSSVAWITIEKRSDVVLFQAHCKNPGDEIVDYKYEFSAIRRDEKVNKSDSFLSGSVRLEPGESKSVSSLILSLPVENVTLRVFQNKKKIAEKKLFF